MVKRRLNEWRAPPNLRAVPTRFPDAWETGFYARTTFFQIISWNWFIPTCMIYQNNEKNMTDLIVSVKIGLDAIFKLMFATHFPAKRYHWLNGLWRVMIHAISHVLSPPFSRSHTTIGQLLDVATIMLWYEKKRPRFLNIHKLTINFKQLSLSYLT